MVYDRSHNVIYRSVIALAIALLGATACRPPVGTGPVAAPAEAPPPDAVVAGPRPVPALERMGGSSTPRLVMAVRKDRESLLAALDRSLVWFGRSSSRKYFPMGSISHERAWASVAVFRHLVTETADPMELEGRILEEFEVYRSNGSDGEGTVLFTGYYSPAFEASLRRSEEYRYPLYGAPADLVVDRESGEVKGRRVGDRIEPFPTRAEIERTGMLGGLEIAWLKDRFEVYLIHVQGSAALLLPDGRTLYASFAGHNGHDYVSVARQLVADGELREDELSLEEVRGYFRSHPEKLRGYLQRNPRFIFFRIDDGTEWPVGSLGVKVTALRSVATDKRVFPPGGVTLVVTRAVDDSGRFRPFEQIMLDQDAGGAILSPGRADIYFGVGPDAEARAGAQYTEGMLFYLFLRPERLAKWRQRGTLDF